MSITASNINDLVSLRETNDGIEPESILKVFSETVKKHGNRRAMLYKNPDMKEWKAYTWKEYYDICKVIANGFLNVGLKKNEGVAILGFNTPEWFIANMAAIMAGGIPVGLYATNSSEVCDHIIKDSNSTIVVVENSLQLSKILPVLEEDDCKIKTVIQYWDSVKTTSSKVVSWSDFVDYSNRMDFKWDLLNDIKNHTRPNKCATLIYTSGTTGLPKGVMLSHDNIMWTVKNVCRIINMNDTEVERVVSYLPLSHVAAQMMDIYLPLYVGGETWFALPSALKGTLVNTLQDAKPTFFLGVPRVWQKIMEKLSAAGKDLGYFKKVISSKAKDMGLEQYKSKSESKPWGWTFYDTIVYKTIKSRIGFDQCRYYFTGAAPISVDILEYFASLNIIINDIYGMSECSGPMTISFGDKYKIGSCGKNIPFTKLKVDKETGEICTYGRHVMMGYLNNESKTKEAIDKDGWLHSGDIGKIDMDGYLFITGRIKEIIITEGGENIPPIIIENNIKKAVPIVSNCMLIGDKRKYLTVLLTLKCVVENDKPTDKLTDEVVEIIKSISSTVTTVSGAQNDAKVLDYIKKGIDESNKKSISRAQRVQKFKVLPNDFSISSGELGPTLKLKRPIVAEKYKDLINQLYS